MSEHAAASLPEDPVIRALYAFAHQSCAQGRLVQLPEHYQPDFPLEASGIDSIMIADLAVTLEEDLQIELDFAGLYRAATLGDLVGLVHRAMGD